MGIPNAAPIGVHNPQINAVCEGMHQVVFNILRTLPHTNPPAQEIMNAKAMIDYDLQVAVYAMRRTVHCWTLGILPG